MGLLLALPSSPHQVPGVKGSPQFRAENRNPHNNLQPTGHLQKAGAMAQNEAMSPHKVSELRRLFDVRLSLEKREKQLEHELSDNRVAIEAIKEQMRHLQEPKAAKEPGQSSSVAMSEQIERWESDKAALSEKKARTVTTIVTPAPDPDRKPN